MQPIEKAMRERANSFVTFTTGLVALVLVVGVSAWVAFGVARDAIVRQVQRTEQLAAGERAGETAALLVRIRPLIDGLASRPSLVAATRAGDTASLQAEVDAVIGNPAVVSASVADSTGTVLARAAKVTGASGRAVGIDSAVPGGGMLHVELAVTLLFPRVTVPLDNFESTVSLVDIEGKVLATNSPVPVSLVESPELLALLAGGGMTRYRPPAADADRIVAVAAVTGTSWAIVVDAPAEVADAVAASLVRRLALVVGGAGVTGGLILAGVGVGLGRARRRLQLQQRSTETLAMTDFVTGLGNRRRLEVAIHELASEGRDACLALLDLDDFKALNDQEGHAAGDAALRLVAARVSAAVRVGDLVVRWGGDEFAVLLPGDAAASLGTIERLRRAVEGVEVPGYGTVRASLGLAAGPADAEVLFHEADLALYEVKRQAKSDW